jgi:serine/threonine-protein kinase
MPPEQIRGKVSRASDVYAASVVLWEALAGRQLFEGDEAELLAEVLGGRIDPPGKHATDLPVAVDALTLRGLERDPARRFATAQDMARALERAVRPASTAEVGAWVESLAGEVLRARSNLVLDMENAVSQLDPANPTPVDVTPVNVPPPEPSHEEVVTALAAETGIMRKLRQRSQSGRFIAAVAAALAVGLTVGVLSRGAFQDAPGPSVSPSPAADPPVVASSEAHPEPRAEVAPEPSEDPVPEKTASAAAVSSVRPPPPRRPPPKPAKGTNLDRVLDTRR